MAYLRAFCKAGIIVRSLAESSVLSHAIDRTHDDWRMTFLYVKDDVTIPTNQIISVSEI